MRVHRVVGASRGSSSWSTSYRQDRPVTSCPEVRTPSVSRGLVRRSFGSLACLVLLAGSTACGGHAFPSDPEGTGGSPAAGGSDTGGSGSTSSGGKGNYGNGGTGGTGGQVVDCLTCDSDEDGIPDGEELAAGLDPFDSDMDDDGLRDGEEDYDNYGVVDPGETNPKEADSDGDSNCDGWLEDVDEDGRSAPGCEFGEVLLVDCDAAPSALQDGHAWSTAFSHPQDALDVAQPGQQLWLRRGICRPQSPQESVVTVVSTHISLHGGFLGTERSFLARPTPPEGTVLEGDLEGDDIDGDPTTGRAEDSRHVVRVFEGAEVMLDGLDVQHGSALLDPANGLGGGVLADANAVLSLRNVRCSNNIAVDGGCLGMTAGTLKARHVTFEKNRAMLNGGAIYLNGTSSELTSVEASSNQAVTGGALALEGAHGTLRDLVLRSNLSTGKGGALFISDGQWQVETAECGDNRAGTGGAISLEGGHLSLKNALLYANRSEGPGGALHSDHGYVTLLQTALVGNLARLESGGALYGDGGSSTLLRVSCVGNRAVSGGCVETYGALSVHTSELRGNRATKGGGAVQFHGPTAVLVNSTVVGNSGESGAALAHLTGNVQLSQLSIAGNYASSAGASIVEVLGGTTRIDNSLLWGNGPNDASLVVTSSLAELLGQGNCAPAPLAALCQATALLTSLPLGCSADGGDCPARTETPCVDAGSDERANAIGFDSSGLSTTAAKADEGAIDAGYHYSTDEARIASLKATATTLSYDTINAASCMLIAASDEKVSHQVIDSTALPSGTLTHDVSTGALHLVCWDSSGRPKAASLEVGSAHQWFDRW